MHEFIIKIFSAIKNVIYFLRIVFVFLILMLLLYWIQNLTHSNWAWMGFIKPLLDSLLETASGICSIQADMWGAVFEFKYLCALIILVACVYILRGLELAADGAEDVYRDTRAMYKKNEQDKMNKQFQIVNEHEERKLLKYSILIRTKIKKKFSHKELGVDINEQNKNMTTFIQEKLAISPMMLNGAFMYQSDNFNHVDDVLDVMFKLIKSSTPLDYAVVVQIGDDLSKLGKLSELEQYGKILIAADTAYRYKFNPTHRYQTMQFGLFQNGEQTLEVHEFKEIL